MTETLFAVFIFGVVIYAIYDFLHTVVLRVLGISDYQKFMRGEYLPLDTWRKHHAKYMKSEHWKKTSYSFRMRHNKCEVKGCGVSGYSNVQAHHLNYNCLGRETDRDLLALCKTHHSMTHYNKTLILRNGKELPPFKVRQ